MKEISLTPSRNVIRKMNDLYIQTRRKYLLQSTDEYIEKLKQEGKPVKEWTSLDRDNPRQTVYPLNDGMIRRHLQGKYTYGVFSGGHFNKFMTFDVDYNDNEPMARWVTLKVVDTLVYEFNISYDDIHVNLSGSKGYHIDLFFDKPLYVKDTELFYHAVMRSIGELPAGGDVEFRPSWDQGVKLPLGIHQRTGSRCWFVDNRTLEPIESFDYILDIEPMDSSLIIDNDFDLTHEQAEEIEQVIQETDTSVTAQTITDGMQKAARIIEAGKLTASNTRHNTTVIIAMFGNMQGWTRAETVDVIMDIMMNTPREYFSKDSTPRHWQKEAQRLVDYAYDNDKRLGNADKPVIIYKSEIIEVLKAGTFRQKQLAYAMLVTSKRYGRVFYLTRASAKKMIGTKSNETVQNGVTKLVSSGFIEYVRRNEIDYARSRESGQVRHKPNKYRLLIDEPADSEPSIKVTSDDNMIDVTYELCTDDEIRQYVKRYEFNNRWMR